MSRKASIPAIVITGPVGSGKSSSAAEVSRLLEAIPVRHVLFDMDHLRWIYPTPDGDPSAAQFGYRNLAALWPNVLEQNPSCVILADVVESRGQKREYEHAMPGTDVTVVRLDVPLQRIAERLRGRESAQTLDWYLRRAPELQALMQREGVGDVVIDVGAQPVSEVAREIIERTGLLQ